MNKKIITICLILVLILAVMCISSCEDVLTNDLRLINTLLRREYDNVQLTIKTDQDGLVLNAFYTFTKQNGNTNIEYQVDKLNRFDVNDNVVGAPDSFKIKVSGSAVFDGNTVTHIDGETVDDKILLDVVEPRMAFISSYFDNVAITNYNFSADVVNPCGFMGDENFDATDMKVQVLYSTTMLGSIKISYKTAGGTSIVMSYMFA